MKDISNKEGSISEREIMQHNHGCIFFKKIALQFKIKKKQWENLYR